MKTILAPTDFSSASLNAVNYAADLSRVLGVQLILLHVCPVPMAFSEVPAPVSVLERLVEDARSQMSELREMTLLRVHDEVRVSTEVLQGDVVMEIEEACGRYHPYAVVMGAESMGPVERWLAGGKTVSAVKHLDWPLLVVPSDARFENIRRIGLACDLRKVVETIPAPEIRELVNRFKAQLHILHVSVEPGESVSEETIDETEWLRDILSDLHPKFHFIYDEEVEHGIQAWADTHQLDMLIVIPKKHRFPASLFHRRQSPKLVMHAHIPVMAIK